MNRTGSDLGAAEKSLTRRRIVLRIAIVGIGMVLFAFIALSGDILNSLAARMAQNSKESPADLWQDVAEASILFRGQRDILPRSYRTFRLNQDALRTRLANTPLEFTPEAKDAPVEISMPMPDGSFQTFQIAESPMVEKEPEEKVPATKNYYGYGIDDPTATIGFNVTPRGLHAFILSQSDFVSIEPLTSIDTSLYISYYKRDDPKEDDVRCFVTDFLNENSAAVSSRITPNFNIGFTLHTYRTAVAATGEYTAAHLGTVADARIAIETRLTGVNVILRRELNIMLVLVANENSIIYLDGNNDPYTSGNLNVLITENQANLDIVIGSANYDIGHVFDVGGSGVAFAGRCNFITKARGTSGGDSIGLAAHEIGHQLGARHTFNDGTNASCGSLNGSNQRSAETALEPGSGSTIMSYAGTCGAGNLQSNWDPYYHAISLLDMTSGGFDDIDDCGVETATGNTPPVIHSQPQSPIFIPAQTPFALTVNATDADGTDVLTYTWEQYDRGNASPPETDDGTRPIFRSYLPSSSPTRVFPRLQYILNNANIPPASVPCSPGGPSTCIPGETLPTTTRDMNFVVTVRDGRGGLAQESLVLVKTRSDFGPFAVTQPNTAVTWTRDLQRTISWNVANTNIAPVGVGNVKISLSNDGGLTFPFVATSSTPNDGSQDLVVPCVGTTQGRIKVEALGNIFFDISDANITIQPIAVTVPNTAVVWTKKTRRTVTWDVDAINGGGCGNVRILLSQDGGQTFPFELLADTPNDGSQEIVLPDIETNQARIKVEGVNGLYFDVSDTNFRIKPLEVTNTNDSGEGSLREAIKDANDTALSPGEVFVTVPFRIPGAGLQTINLASELPHITAPVFIDGKSQPGFAGVPLIELNGAGVGEPNAIGLTLTGGNATIQDLVINRFSGSGIRLLTNGGNVIRSCRIGTNQAGNSVLGNGANGIFIDNSPNNDIGVGSIALFPGNIISGNNVGILISGSNSSANKVQNNMIGTNTAGADVGNAFAGIRINGAPNNLIGGTDSDNGLSFSVGNVISSNGPVGGADGIEVTGGSGGTIIQGNVVGLEATGTTALRNSRFGISLNNAPNTQIGGTTAGERNVISGNRSYGISLTGNTAGTRIQGNYLGTNVDGVAAVANGTSDIYVESGNNQIGGTIAGSGNVIAGFASGAGRCIYLRSIGATNNVIQGNYIGTDKTGSVALNGGGTGIELLRASDNTIGGTTAAARNLISGNFAGLVLGDSGANVVQGNYIGTNAAGTAALGNAGVAVQIDSGANNIIGGIAAGAGNVISGNGAGLVISGAATASGNLVQGNFIGTNAAGTAALGNTGRGVAISPTNGSNNIIGGSGPGARNLISGNGGLGIRIAGGTGTVVQGNYIGTDITGTVNLGNGQQDGNSGIELAAGSGNIIGGVGPGEGNIIAFSGCAPCSFTPRSGSGIFVFGGSTGNRIRGNSIFANAELAINLNGGTEDQFRITANDSCDADTGANELQNFPVLSSAVNTGVNTAIQGTLNSAAGGAFTIDFYSNPACDASGNGEGKTYLGSTIVNTDAGCNALINFTLPLGVLAGQFVTATATDSLGNTSEFSNCVSVQSSIPTPAGDNVVVKSSGVTITFPTVTAAGNTTITPIDPGSAGALPSGFTLCSNCPAFDITTTANYTPPVGVCIDIPAIVDQQTFNSLKLLHGENGVLVDRTTGRQTDPQTGVRSVCGSVNSLSPFLIAQGPTPTPSPTPTPTPMVSNLQFSSSNYNGVEDCAVTVVTVTRTGDSSGAVSVDYVTSDGSAMQRTDYTIALGTLNFASGETSRSFVVLITEDSYAEGTETVTITLSNPTGGAVLGSQSTATLTILDDATEAGGNPIDVAGNYVCQHYHDFLNREPDPAGLAFWINEITSCGTDAPCIERKRINVSAAYFLSIEFQQTGYLVYRFYNAALNRSNGLPRYLEFLRDTQTVGRGVVVGAPGWEAQVEANKVAFAGDFVARGEFTALYPFSQTPSQYVDALYARASVTPSAAERQASIDEFAGAATSADAAARGRVLRRVVENQTFYQREFNRAFVLMQYFGYLRRNPDDLPDNNLDGYNFWLGKLNQFSGDFVAAEMVKAFLVSGEYRSRFGPP